MLAFLCVALFSPQRANAEGLHWCDSVYVSAEVSASGSTNDDLNPLWLYSQRWGVYSQYEQAELLAHLKANLRIANYRYFTLNAGLGVVGSTHLSHSMLHEAYLSGKAFVFDYTAGMQAYSPLAQNDRLTSGHYLMSSNARPTPRVGIGIFDYLSIPFTRDWLQVRGAIYVGKLFNEFDADDEYARRYTDDVIFHEKFAYARIGGWHLKPYLGLAHSVMMGGTLCNGIEVPKDFWASFFAKGSDKFTGYFRGESTNAAGAHQGVWDVGIDFDFDALDGSLYVNRHFADDTGRSFFDDRSHDFYLGVILNFHHTSHIKSVAVEWMNTDWQGGEGQPDPHGWDDFGNEITIFPGDIPKESAPLEAWFRQHFTDETLSQYASYSGFNAYDTRADAYHFFEYYWNHGWYHGGRSNCLSNGFYPQGWSADGLSMSSAYFHSQPTVEKYASGYNWPHNSAYPNYRVDALTLAVDAQVNSRLSALAKLGITRNHGNLVDKYSTPYSWTHTDNYYFDRSRMEYYFLLDASWLYSDCLSFRGSFAADWGNLYSAVGLRLSAVYSFGHLRKPNSSAR